MKVVFLDMDGVLNSDPFLAQGSWDNPEHRWPGGHVDPENVKHFNRLMAESGATLVLSSSWRKIIKEDDLTLVLQKKGYTGPAIMDRTPPDIRTKMSENVPRHKEIRHWLKRHPEVTAFVILDDCWDAEIKGHFVKTSPVVGLTSDDVDLALKILG